MIVAGVVTVLLHALKQPVVLGYIIAGLIIGPYTPPHPLITDEVTIRTLAELGVVFLLFSLGLEFNLRKLRAVGATAAVAALAEIVLMIWVGYEIGRYFGWSTMDAVFLGAMLSISSTTIIVKALAELGKGNEPFAQLIFGILIVEDILAIAILALLSGIAMTGGVQAMEVVATVGRLGIFIVIALVLGLLLVPRLIGYVARFNSNEMLLVTVLGLCFGFSLLVVKLGYSIALGAFIMGAIIAEAREQSIIERLIEPVRDLFSAIFFVSVGLLLDPRVLVDYAVPIAVITLAVIAGKILTCSLGTFLAGNDGRTSMQVGLGLAQIGEFSFIIAALGTTLGVTSDFLYPIAVAVSAITTLLTPYLIRSADALAGAVERTVPRSMAGLLTLYPQWLQGLRLSGDHAIIAGTVRRILVQVTVNAAIVVALFLGGPWLARTGAEWLPFGLGSTTIRNSALWSAALLLALPFLVAIYRKIEALSMLLAEIGLPDRHDGMSFAAVRQLVARVIPLAALAGLGLLLAALSSAILPPLEVLIVVLIIVTLLTAFFWQNFVRLHSRLQIALLESITPAQQQDRRQG